MNIRNQKIIKRFYISLQIVLFFYFLHSFSNLQGFLEPVRYFKWNQSKLEEQEIGKLIADNDFETTGKLKLKPALPFRIHRKLSGTSIISKDTGFGRKSVFQLKEDGPFILRLPVENNRPNYEKLRNIFPQIDGELSKIERRYSTKIRNLEIKSYLKWFGANVLFTILFFIGTIIVWYLLKLVFKIISIYLTWLFAKNDSL